jgi:hypothetical protein
MVDKEITRLVGRLITFDRKREEETSSGDTVIEVVDFNGSSEVEIAFNDRNERCYLKFSLAQLIAMVSAHACNKERV